MNKYLLKGLFIIAILIAGFFLLDNEIPGDNQIIDVDLVAENPQNYKNLISVSGTIKEISEDGTYLVLGCEDACVMIPVKYDGFSPTLDENVVVQGKIEMNEDAKYVFNAAQIWKR